MVNIVVLLYTIEGIVGFFHDPSVPLSQCSQRPSSADWYILDTSYPLDPIWYLISAGWQQFWVKLLSTNYNKKNSVRR